MHIGCGCQYTAYGCCPDNKTIARGPDNQGCGCQYTQHGCCPNKYTPAAGPNFQGCSCYTYQFGCCPDGITRAIGPNLLGKFYKFVYIICIYIFLSQCLFFTINQ